MPSNNTLAAIDGQQHPLDREAGKLLSVARRLRRRCEWQLRIVERADMALIDKAKRELPDELASLAIDALDPATIAKLPPDWAWTFKAYADTVLALLREQRQRARLGLHIAKMRGGSAPLTDEEFRRELSTIAREELLSMSPAVFADLVNARKKAAEPAQIEDFIEAEGAETDDEPEQAP